MSGRTHNGENTTPRCAAVGQAPCLSMPLEWPGEVLGCLWPQESPPGPRILESAPWGLWDSPFTAMGEHQGCRQSMHGSGQKEPVHRKRSAWAPNESL